MDTPEFKIQIRFPIASENTGTVLNEYGDTVIDTILLSPRDTLIEVFINGDEMVTSCIYLVENPYIKNIIIFYMKETRTREMIALYKYLKDYGRIVEVQSLNAQNDISREAATPYSRFGIILPKEF